jgi:hypothetical protein
VAIRSSQLCVTYMLTIFPYWSSSFTVGGHQTLKHKHLQRHPLLRRFPICRVWSALLCSQYNAEMPRNKVISAAAEKMLSHFHQAKRHPVPTNRTMFCFKRLSIQSSRTRHAGLRCGRIIPLSVIQLVIIKMFFQRTHPTQLKTR